MKKLPVNKSGRAVSQPINTRASVGAQISEADRALFTVAELKALEAEVAIEVSQDVKDEARERVRERLKQSKRLEMQRALEPDEQMHFITIDVAPFADRITIDNVIYLHGLTYEVPRRMFDSMREVIARTWKHEHDIGNANSQHYRRPRNVVLGPRDAGMPASQLMRV